MPLGPHTVSVRKGIFELSRTCPFQELSRCQSCKHRAFAFSSVPRRRRSRAHHTYVYYLYLATEEKCRF